MTQLHESSSIYHLTFALFGCAGDQVEDNDDAVGEFFFQKDSTFSSLHQFTDTRFSMQQKKETHTTMRKMTTWTKMQKWDTPILKMPMTC